MEAGVDRWMFESHGGVAGIKCSRAFLVNGQVTIIFVVSVCLFVCLFVQSFSQSSLIRFQSN